MRVAQCLIQIDWQRLHYRCGSCLLLGEGLLGSWVSTFSRYLNKRVNQEYRLPVGSHSNHLGAKYYITYALLVVLQLVFVI